MSRDQSAIAVITGEIDGKTAPLVQAELLPVIQQHDKVILDMRSVVYLSSAGLRMLLLAYRQAAARESDLLLAGLSEEIRDTMEMTGFLDFFTTVDTVEAGLLA
ncbi:MAG TPA: STAS domain-containing protein [Chthonomonadaceae bacterium]|nr:STAS domain-containing protein [Chthonomonadaceae bacterium]